MNKSAIPEPMAKKGKVDIWPLVIEDIKARVEAAKQNKGCNQSKYFIRSGYQEYK